MSHSQLRHVQKHYPAFLSLDPENFVPASYLEDMKAAEDKWVFVPDVEPLPTGVRRSLMRAAFNIKD